MSCSDFVFWQVCDSVLHKINSSMCFLMSWKMFFLEYLSSFQYIVFEALFLSVSLPFIFCRIWRQYIVSTANKFLLIFIAIPLCTKRWLLFFVIISIIRIDSLVQKNGFVAYMIESKKISFFFNFKMWISLKNIWFVCKLIKLN